MRKTKIGIVLLSLALALVFGLVRGAERVEAAKPALECSVVLNNGITVSAESCFVNGYNQSQNYQDVEITFTNGSTEAVTWINYKDGRAGDYKVALKESDSALAPGNSLTFNAPIKLNESYKFDITYKTASGYVLINQEQVNGYDLGEYHFTFRTDVAEPDIRVTSNGVEGSGNYNREFDYTITVKDPTINASGLAEIRYELTDESATLTTKDQFTNTISEFASSDQIYAGENKFAYTLNINETGAYKLWVYAEDYAGNHYIYEDDAVFYIDADAPVIIADKTSGETAVTHTVNLTVTDSLSEIKTAKYAWKMSEQTWDDVEFVDLPLVGSSASIVTPNANATYQYKIIVEDAAGNVATKESGDFVVLSGSAAVTLEFVGDTTIPAKEFSVIVRVSKDHTPEVKKIIIVWVPNGTPRPVDSSAGVYDFYAEYEVVDGVDNEHTFTTTEEMAGKYVVSMIVIQSEDPLVFYIQNEGRILTIDKVAPTVEFISNGSEVYTNQLTVGVTVRDDNAAAEAFLYLFAEASLELSKADIINEATSGSVVNFTGETGSYRLWVLAYDKAGNEVIVASNPFLVDTTAPTVVLGNVKEFYTQGDEVEVTFADAHSGVDQVAYAFVAADADEPADEAYKTSKDKKIYMDVKASGSYKLFVKVVDAAGNVTKCGFAETFIVDLDAPVVEGAESAGYYTGETAIKVTDANLKAVTLNGEAKEAEFTLSETGIYHLVATDVAGNVTRVDFIVNREGKANINNEVYNVKRQILLPVLKADEEATYYIVLPKGDYNKGDVMVMTKEAGETTKMLEQKSSYIVVKESVIEILSRRSDSYNVTDKEFTDAQVSEAGNYGWVIVDVMSNDEAKGLGINTTVIDNEAIALTAGIAGCLSLIAVFVIYRSKKTVRL